jgi:hypothetical protein
MFLEFGNIWNSIRLGFFFLFSSAFLLCFYHCGPGPGRKRQKQEGLTTDWRLFVSAYFRFFAVRQSYALFYYILDTCICRFWDDRGLAWPSALDLGIFIYVFANKTCFAMIRFEYLRFPFFSVVVTTSLIGLRSRL